MRLFNLASIALSVGFSMAATSGAAKCLSKSVAKYMDPEYIEAVCSAEALMPFKVKTRYLGDGGYHAFASNPQKAGPKEFSYQVGMMTTQAAPMPSLSHAKRGMAHFERRTGCTASDLRHSQVGPSFFDVTCPYTGKTGSAVP